MHFRKFISMWALLALMLGQVALVQHSATHADHGFSQEVVVFHDGNDEHQNDQDNKKHDCPECLITKSLQTAFYNVSSIFPVNSAAKTLALPKQSYVIVENHYRANSPRAPPAILI